MAGLLRLPLDALPLTFLDVETTGLSPQQGHRVCEVALLRVRGAHVEARWSSLVNPQRQVDERAFAVNRISAAMLEDAPLFAAIADQVVQHMAESVLIAHNAPFDRAFLRMEFKQLGRTFPRLPFIDTLRLAKLLLPRRSSYSLQALAHDLHLPPPGHRAMQDVLALHGLFGHLRTHLATLEISTLEELLRCERGLMPNQPDPVPPPLVQQALEAGQCLRIVYRSRSTPEATERVVAPLVLAQEGNRVFLRAYCFLRQDERSFALDKIEAMELVEAGHDAEG
jgi:DNA polymerase-3 subunit epsilon